MPPTKAKLVTVIVVYECHDSVRKALRRLGLKAYSVARCEGHGAHGTQQGGLSGNANFVFSVVTTAALATKLLAWVERDLVHKDFPAIAYSADVEAVLGAPHGGKES